MVTELTNEIKPDEQLGVSDPLNSNADATQQQVQTPPSDPFSTLTSNEIIVQNGLIRSGNFVTNSAGWRIQASGNAEFNDGTFRGTLTAAAINIPDTTTANSFHVNTDGDAWWGATTLASGVAWVKKDGSAKFTSGTVGGFTLGTDTLTATNLIINTTNQTIAVGASPNTITINGSNGTITGKSGTWTLNGDGTVTNIVIFKNGSFTRAGDTASGNQTIAHGLGVTPKYVRLTGLHLNPDNQLSQSSGVYNATTVSTTISVSSGTGSVAQISSTDIAYLRRANDANKQTATITMDATNIILAWTKAGSGVGTADMNFIWEAWA